MPFAQHEPAVEPKMSLRREGRLAGVMQERRTDAGRDRETAVGAMPHDPRGVAEAAVFRGERSRSQEISAEQVAGQAAEERAWTIEEGIGARFLLAQHPHGIQRHGREQPGGPPALDPAVLLRVADEDRPAHDRVGRAFLQRREQMQHLFAGNRVAGRADIDMPAFRRRNALVPGFVEPARALDDAQAGVLQVLDDVLERSI